MLTPQEVSEHTFQKVSFGGYNMAQVDEFLDILTGDYSALFNENAVLKSKMKVLVDKVEEYRTTEEAMRKALMAAQRMADELVKEAEQKKAEMLAKTEKELRERQSLMAKDFQAEEYRLRQAQRTTAAFVDKVRALHAQEEEYLSRLQELCPPDAEAAADPVDEAVSEIDDNVQRLLDQAMQAAAQGLRGEDEEDDMDDEDDLADTAEFGPVPPDGEDVPLDDEEYEEYEEEEGEAPAGAPTPPDRLWPAPVRPGLSDYLSPYNNKRCQYPYPSPGQGHCVVSPRCQKWRCFP